MDSIKKFGEEFLISEEIYSLYPDVSPLINGNFIATWVDYGNDSRGNIKAQIFDINGKKLGNDFFVNSQVKYLQSQPQAVGLDNGGFVITWMSGGGQSRDDFGIKAQLFGPDAAKLGGEFLVSSTPSAPKITVLASGRFVIAWQDGGGDSGGSSIQAQLFNKNGKKIGAPFLANTDGAPTNQEEPSIGQLKDGKFAVAWKENSSIKGQLFKANGSPFGNEIIISSDIYENDYTRIRNSPSITGLENGNFVVTWQLYSGSSGDDLGDREGSSIVAQLFRSNGAKLGKEFRVNTNIGFGQELGEQQAPKVTSFSNGGFAIAWCDFSQTLGDSSGSSIKVQLFDSVGTEVGSEFLVNTSTYGYQRIPDIASLSPSKIVITWNDGTKEANFFNARAQVFTIESGIEIVKNDRFDLSRVIILENKKEVTTVIAGGLYTNTKFNFSIVGGEDANLFNIESNTGALKFKVAPNFEDPSDADNDNTYNVLLQVSNGVSTDQQVATITINDLTNELLVGTSQADTLQGAGGNDTLKGGAGNDQLYGGAGNDKLAGGAGADRMFGGAGNDTYYVENAGDRVYETATETASDNTNLGGKDTVVSSIGFTLGKFVENLTQTGTGNINGTGNELSNTLLGNAGANTLKGLSGNDTLKGGAGNDLLFGGDGKDTLTGGTGQDLFVFNTAPTSRDTITDFSAAEGDKIQLSKAVFTGLAYTGTLHADDFYAAAGATKAHDATDRVIYNTTTGVLYYDADGLGGTAAVQIALLGASTHPALVYGDLQIIA